MTVDVHVEDARLLPKEVVMKRGDIQTVVEQRRHDRIDFVLRQHQIAHHHVHPTRAFGHRDPAAEPEWRRRLHVRHGDAKVVARNIDLEHVRLVVALLAKRGEHLLVLGRNVLRKRGRRAQQERCRTH